MICCATYRMNFSEWEHEPDRPVAPKAIHAAHSLAGSSATVGITALQEVAHALEIYLQTIEYQPTVLTSVEYDALLHCVNTLKAMMQQVALGDLPAAQPFLVSMLTQMQQAAATPAASAPTLVEPDQSLYASFPLGEHDDEGESSLELKDNLDPELLPVFLDEGRDLLPQIGQSLREWLGNTSDVTHVPDILRLLHTTKGSARMAGAMSLGQHLHQMETQIERIVNSGGRTPLCLKICWRAMITACSYLISCRIPTNTNLNHRLKSSRSLTRHQPLCLNLPPSPTPLQQPKWLAQKPQPQ